MKQTKALILLNMGAARSKAELQEFLLNMFNDKNILTINNNFSRSLLASFITKNRLDKAWENYELIGGKSPLHSISESLKSKLQILMPDTLILLAMRYTKPFASNAIQQLKDKNIKDIVLLPLYPQYSTTTTKSSVEDFIQYCPNSFNIKTIKPFYKNNELNEIIVNEIIQKRNNDNSFHLIFSAHGLPKKIITNGDTYQIQIQEHIELIKQKLKHKNIKFNSISLAYQSKVGPMQWLEPSLDDALKQYKGKNVLIYPISFMCENSETIFELSIEYKHIASKLEVNKYIVCSCPNDKDTTATMIKDMISYE